MIVRNVFAYKVAIYFFWILHACSDLLYSDYDGYSQFPIGIDPQRFFNALETPEVQMYIKELQDQFAGRKVLIFSNCVIWNLIYNDYYFIQSRVLQMYTM